MKRVWAIALAVVLTGCGELQEQRVDVPVTDGSANRTPLEVVCVGRVQIDFPRGRSSWSQGIEEVSIELLPNSFQSREDFIAWIHARRDELGEKNHVSEGSILSLYEELDRNTVRIISRTRETDVRLYRVQHYKWLGGMVLLANAEISSEGNQSRIEGLYAYINKLKPPAEVGLPSTAGFCIDGGLIESVDPDQQAHASLRVDVDRWRKVSLGIAYIEGRPIRGRQDDLTRQHESRLDRELQARKEFAPQAEEIPAYPRELDVMRRHTRSVAGLPGQETLWRAELNNGGKLYRFGWSSGITDDSSGVPYFVSVSLSAGDEDHPEAAPPDEAELLALWDAALASLQVRLRAYAR